MIRRKVIFVVFAGIIALSAITLTTIYRPQTVSGETVEEKEARLRAELDQVLKEISDQQQILTDEYKKGVSLERDIAILNAKIQEAKLNIRAHNLAIEALGKDISTKTLTINELSDRISDSRDSLAQLVRKTNEMDAFTLTDVVLSNKNISEFFEDVDAFDSIKESIQVNLGTIRKSKSDTEVARQQLDKKRLEEINVRISIEDEKAKIEKNENEKNRLLSLSKEQQKNYKTEIGKKEQRAQAIRTALFSLRDTAAIPFGDALAFATEASQATGVRPAFLLGILTQESNLGQNVGACYVTNLQTGDGVKVTSGAPVSGVIKPGRDLQPFIRITSELGRDPANTRVSCPLSTGYGGAMGPSQFIPSTWELFKPRLAQALSKSVPDPWMPKDAFMASALYLADLGAGNGDAAGERNAACRYYSGRACDSRRPANAFYGDQVMAKARSIQINMIDPLSGN
jgi:membrane-bound lytic murein transglycosylase B